MIVLEKQYRLHLYDTQYKSGEEQFSDICSTMRKMLDHMLANPSDWEMDSQFLRFRYEVMAWIAKAYCAEVLRDWQLLDYTETAHRFFDRWERIRKKEPVPVNW